MPFAGVRRRLAAGYVRHFLRLWPYLGWRFFHRGNYRAAPPRFWEDVALRRGGAALDSVPASADGPLISVVVRTCRRPEALRRALTCLANQTWPHWEAVVVEDGEPHARQVAEEFAHLPVRYHATGRHVGRGRAGNVGLELAGGAWLCFLDDDDMLYPEHLELMAAQARRCPEADLVLGTSLVALEYGDGRPGELKLMRFDRLDNFTMSQMCQIPIESGMFKRELYECRGGLADHLEAHEDWWMWLRLLAAGRRANPRKADIARATSVFVQPADAGEAARRLAGYRKSDAALFGDDSLRFEVTLADMRRYYDGMIADMLHLQKRGELKTFLQRQAGRDKPETR
jgi:glycosyltransferase involved in cell wall biosynthesis